jgi:hypothetical protein
MFFIPYAVTACMLGGGGSTTRAIIMNVCKTEFILVLKFLEVLITVIYFPRRFCSGHCPPARAFIMEAVCLALELIPQFSSVPVSTVAPVRIHSYITTHFQLTEMSQITSRHTCYQSGAFAQTDLHHYVI